MSGGAAIMGGVAAVSFTNSQIINSNNNSTQGIKLMNCMSSEVICNAQEWFLPILLLGYLIIFITLLIVIFKK